MSVEIVMCIPKIKSRQLQDIYPPIGLAYIHSSLLAAGYNVRTINLNFNDLSKLGELIKERKTDFVLSGGTSYDYEALEELFSYVKTVDETVVTIGGGVGYTSEPTIFAELTKVDYAVIGEGEVTDIELIECLIKRESVHELCGIVYKDENGEYCKTREAVSIQDIDALPFPNYDGFEIEKYFQNQREHGFPRHFSDVDEPRVMLMLNSRSCPYHCSFCFHPIGSNYRVRNMDSVFEEIEVNISKYRINGIFFADELFANNKERVCTFCDRIKKYDLRWFVELRVDFVTEELITMLKESGCVSVLLGLEGYTDKVLKDMRKGITPNQIKSAVEIMYKVGMRMEGHFIFGSPLEDENTYRDIFDFWRDYRWAGVDIVWLFLYPGTRYYDLACQKGIIENKKQFIISKMPHLNITEMDSETYSKYARISSLSLMDEDHYGDIISRKVVKNKCDFELVCAHCGNKFIYKNVPLVDVEKSTGRLNLEIQCDNCEKYSFFPIREKENFVIYLVEKQLDSNHVVGYDISSKLFEKSLHRIGIIGEENITEPLEKELQDVEIAFSTSLSNYMISRNRDEFGNVDAIIIADLIHYQKTENVLKKAGNTVPLLSAVNLIFDFEYHKGRSV